MAWLMHPQELGERIAGLSSALWELQWHTWRRAVGLPSPAGQAQRRRPAATTDPVWTDSATWDLVKGGTSPSPTTCPGHALRHSGAVEQGAPARRLLVAQVAQRGGARNYLLTNPLAR